MAAAKQWEQQAAATQMINRALEYLRTPEVKHTANMWQPHPNNNDLEEISNRVYKMSCRIREDTKYDTETKQSVPVAWLCDLGFVFEFTEGLATVFISQDRTRNVIQIKPLP